MLGNDVENILVEVLCMGSARSADPPVVLVGGRAQAELRAGEALVFDWTRLAFCCAVAGEVSLRPTTLQEAQRSSAYVALSSEGGPFVFAHRRAYPMLVGCTMRSTAGAAWVSARSPPHCLPTWGCGRRSGAKLGTDLVTAGRAWLWTLILPAADAQPCPAGSWIFRA
jgi:hypothetical protein